MAEMATAVKYKLPIKVFVVKNNTLGQIKWERGSFGESRVWVRTTPDRLRRLARACGATAFTIDDPQSCGSILDQALAAPGPVLVEAIVDPV